MPRARTERAALALCAALLLAGAGCRTARPLPDGVVASVAQAFAPDPRVARFDVEVARSGGALVVAGETTEPAALAALRDSLARRGLAAQWRVDVLPDADVRAQPFGLVTVSVANLRSEPRHSAELATQALLGTPVRVLKGQGGFLLVQTPDRYLAWTDAGAIARRDTLGIQAAERAPKVVFLPTYGFALDAPRDGAGRVSDLVAGALLEKTGETGSFVAVRFPDGRDAFVAAADVQPFEEWQARPPATGPALVQTAQTLLGVPYLWGGTSAKGMDCSGFTRTVYQLNGLFLPRDASQQEATGIVVDSTGDWSRLVPGDLLFFGRKASGDGPERVIHVGMWIGDGRFIHASGQVRVNSMNPDADDYDAYDRGRYLRTRRILAQPDRAVIRLDDGRGLFSLMPPARP